MATKARTIATAVLGAMALSALGAVAWACTGQSQVQIIPTVVPPHRRTAVTQVAGRPFSPGAVTIRWNAVDGPQLATTQLAEGQELKVDFVVPEVPAGVYYVVVQGGSGDEIARAAIEVTGSTGQPAAARGSADLWQGFEMATGAEAEAGAGSAAEAGRNGPSVPAGYGLLAAGLVLAGTFAVVAVRRRSTQSS